MRTVTSLKLSVVSEAVFTTDLIESSMFFNSIPIFLDCAVEVSESFQISSATTLNPFPDSPAWAASIAAFIASRFV